MFVPSDIPAPAIQAQGETVDAILDPVPIPTPTPIPAATPPLLPPPPLSTPASQSAFQPAEPAYQVPPTPIPTPFPTPTPIKRVSAPTYTSPTAPPPSSYTSSSSSSSTSQNTVITQSQINSLVKQATDNRDASLATRVGWGYFNRNEFSSAGIWFNQALEWDPNNGDASYGLALSKFREGDVSSAEAISNFRQGSSPKMKVLQGDINSRRGTEAYEAQNYAESLSYFNKAAAYRTLSRNEQIIVGWDLYYTKQYAESAKLFERLYRASPDNITAQGAYASLSKLKAYDELDSLAAEKSGPLRQNYVNQTARNYYQAHLYQASSDAGGQKVYRVLQNYTTPSAALGLSYRSKSGSEGEGQLQATTIPVAQFQIYPANKFMLSGYIDHLNLNSGSLPNGAEVGQFPKTFTPYSFKMNTSENDLWEFGLHAEYQDWVTWYASFGTTPLNGPLQARPIGNFGLIWRDTHGYVQGEIYSKSIKESITSWVGSIDPYSGNKWGRVTETGGAISFFRSIGNTANTFYLHGSYGEIQGTNVESNRHFSGVAALAHVFDVKGFEYVTLGVALSYEHYDNNQNHFTYGNGGYFSPQYLVQGLVQAQFLTKEGRNWIAAGSAGAGIQQNQQNGGPLFPLDDDGRSYDSQKSTTGIGLIQVQGGYLINGNFMVGGGFGYAVTADYNEGFVSLYLRYFFEKRNGLLRSDMISWDYFNH